MRNLKLVSSNQLIGELYQDFNVAGSEWVHKARRHIARGIELMEISGYYERATLWDTVEEYSVAIPCDSKVLMTVLVEAALPVTEYTEALAIATAPAANSTDENGSTIEVTYNETTSLVRLPLRNSLVIGKDFNNIASHQSARGYINLDRLHTNFETGNVMFIYYRPPLDENDYPMIPDEALVMEALGYWLIYKMSLGGYKHPIIDFKTALEMWDRLSPRAKNRINYPTLEERQSITEVLNNPIMGDWANKLYFH